MAVTLFRFDEDYYTSSPTMATTFGSGTPGPTYTNLVMVVMFSNSPGATSSPGAGWTLLARTETLASSNRSIENYIYGNPQYVVAEMWWSTTTSSLSGTQTGVTWGAWRWAFTGAATTTPLIDSTAGHTYTGTSPPTWVPSLSDSVSITGSGNPILLSVYQGAARRRLAAPVYNVPGGRRGADSPPPGGVVPPASNPSWTINGDTEYFTSGCSFLVMLSPVPTPVLTHTGGMTT